MISTITNEEKVVKKETFSAIDLYDRLSTASDERTRARIIADAFADVDMMRYSHVPSDVATKANLLETELKLTKDIEMVRLELTKEIERVKLELTKEIEKIRLETKEMELRLTKEIEKVRYDLTKSIEQVRASLIKWSFLFWLTQFSAIMALIFKI